MKYLRPLRSFDTPLARALLVTAVAFLPAVTSCGAKSNEASSTDTGNPPVVDHRKIDVTSTPDGVLVRGRDGAVQPGGAEVVVRNVTSGDSARVTASEAGSFEAELAGSVADEYEVEATADGRSTDVSLPIQSAPADNADGTPTADDADDANDADPVDESSCDAGALAADALVDTQMGSLSEGCSSDDECFVIFAPTCGWDCAQRPMYVADSNSGALNELHATIPRTCEAALGGEDCGQPNCTSNDPSEHAVCRDGRCVDSGIQPTPPDTAVGGDDTESGEPQACVWGVDQLLAEVGAQVEGERLDCGSTNGAFIDGVAELYECFDEASPDPGAQFTLNNCTDCSIPSTYVSTPDGNFYHVLMEADLFGDQWREAKVERCESIELAGGINCTSSEELYSCTDAIR